MQPKLLLLAKDAIFEALQQKLSVEHYEISRAKTVRDAVRLLSQQQFDLALIDPQVDEHYVDVIRAAHRAAETVYLPVILLADEQNNATTIVRGLEAGADDYVTLDAATDLLDARLWLHINYMRKLQARDHTIAELQSSRDAHNQMVQMVTHDLLHPVSNIQLAEDMLRQTADEATRKSILDSVRAAINSMQEALEDLNAASSIELSSLPLNIAPVAVGKLMDEIFLANAARINNKDMTVALPETSLSVLADRDKLRRVLENLLTNAVKYSPGGTTITLDASQKNGYVRLLVEDEGPGIPNDEAHLLFTRFGRLSTRPTGEETSTGLGLWIVKILVEAMDGRIGVESEYGKGATFWVELPLAAD